MGQVDAMRADLAEQEEDAEGQGLPAYGAGDALLPHHLPARESHTRRSVLLMLQHEYDNPGAVSVDARLLLAHLPASVPQRLPERVVAPVVPLEPCSITSPPYT